MFGVKDRIFKVKELIYIGLKLIHIKKNTFFGHICQPSWISMICINLRCYSVHDNGVPSTPL